MALTKRETRLLYRKRARHYDRTMWIFRAFGFHMGHYRRCAVDALGLKPGDTVVELGCGTGLNFPLLQAIVGPQGRVVGVDLTDAMLDVARRRAWAEHWDNVQLVQADLVDYPVPPGTAGILSTFAITLAEDYDRAIRRAARALEPGGRLGILDFRRPGRWPEPLVRLAAWMNRPFGVSLDLASRHPWESVRRYLQEVHYEEFYGGSVYLSVGVSAPAPRENPYKDPS